MVLEAGLGLAEGSEAPADVRRHVAAGRTVEAIRELRRGTSRGLSVTAAERMVGALAADALAC